MKILTKEMLEASNEQLSESMYKNLKGRRYVIVLDDVWDTKVFDDLKRLFPNNKNGSRIMLTTRLEKVANHGNSSRPYHLRFLNWDESWNLFCGKESIIILPTACRIRSYGPSSILENGKISVSWILTLGYLKVWEMESSTMTKSSSVIVEMVNLRYLACTCKDVTFLSSLHKLRNLHTIIVRNISSTYVGLNIWKMPQLRHVQLNHVVLPDPPTTEAEEENCFIVLEHLQTLSMVYDFKLTLEILKRIPNLKKLRIHYEQRRWNWGDYC
ncbi:late blight resistance homolog R1B-8 [Olea europaea subsp. europaea]|uniref:Late blight resistance homolog R1B-8 n=1 Tax=Olea europaea subsp. europaea TaxID=158383 RepID=A0A8S0R5Q8_OLEEU|nr:late blight resistance homolog R1B-8 [Olea europaea subsp. europaea]